MSTESPFRVLSLLAISASALLWSGCETTAPTVAEAEKPAAPAFPRESMKQLHVGMPKATVVELIGRPTEIKQVDTETGEAEVWTYVNWLDPVYREVAVELEETSYIDPVTGIERTILDPRPQMERITRKEFFELTFDDNELIVDLNYDLQQFREI